MKIHIGHTFLIGMHLQLSNGTYIQVYVFEQIFVYISLHISVYLWRCKYTLKWNIFANDAIYVFRRIYKYKKKKERTNANICEYKYIIYIYMTPRKLLQDLKAGFQEPRTERGDRRITSIPFYIREISMDKNCFCMLLSRRHGDKERPWYELASPQAYIDRDITKN